MLPLLRRLRDWLTLADYDAAKRDATKQVVARYSRNIAAQHGRILFREDQERMHAEAVKIAKKWEKRAANHKARQ